MNTVPRQKSSHPGGRRSLFVTLCLMLLGLFARPAAAADFELRRVGRVGQGLAIYHDPVQATGPVEMRVGLNHGGCDVKDPPRNVRQAGDSFATLLVIDRGDPHSLGHWSQQILGGVTDFLRAELGAQRPAPDEYALLDSYGTPPPREQPLTSSEPTLEGFLSSAPKPEAAGAAVYRRTLDAMKLLEPTTRPLRAIMIISDGRDPNLYPGGVAEDTLLIEKSKELGAPIFAVLISRTPLNKTHRAELQAAAQRLQSVAVRTGGTVVREVHADDALRASLSQALSFFAQQIGTWQRTDCKLCGPVAPGDLSVDVAAMQDEKPVAHSRKPFLTRLGSVDSVPACQQCESAVACSCKGDAKAECRNGKCRCQGECSSKDDCEKGETCKRGKCEKGTPWLWVALGGVVLLFGLIALVVIVQVVSRSRASEDRRREEEDRRRRDAEAWRLRAGQDDRRRAEEAERRRQNEERRRPEPAADRYRPSPTPSPAPAPAPFRLHSSSAGYGDIALLEGATVIGGDAGAVQAAVAGLAPDVSGHAVVLGASTISGRHAVVRVIQGAVTVTDLGSTNGTFVNGVKIQPNGIVELRPGDEVQLSRQVVFVLEAVAIVGGRH
jgi:hypothetical protein